MSSDEEGNDDIPEISVAEERIKMFAEITSTDEACAQFYLQDRKWDLERSVNDFFEDRRNKATLRVNDESEANVVLFVDGSRRSLAAAATAVVTETLLSSDEPANKRAKSSDSNTNAPLDVDEPIVMSNIVKFITWNMDGINEKNLIIRTKAICKHIREQEADIVFLQEVVPESASYFLMHLKEYKCLFGNDCGYFVGTFIKKSSIEFEDYKIHNFDNSLMMRNILCLNVRYGDILLYLMNAHLESTADGQDERKEQLKDGLQKVVQAPADRTVIFAGDMNLRDKELVAIGGLPSTVDDVWIRCGSRKEVTYTWDMTRNDNLMFTGGKFKPRMRFDRVYFRASTPSKIFPKFFGLIGLERLLPHRCFPSDHWGILCHYEIK